MHRRIYAVRNEKTVTVLYDGKQNYVECSDEEEAKELMVLANTAKNHPLETERESAFKELQVKLDPSYAIEYLNNEGKVFSLVRNRKGEVFLKNTNVPMPQNIVQSIVSLVSDNLPYDHLINFWTLCLQNPDDRAREDLFKFLSTYNFPITDYGYFIGYKAVYFKGEKNRYLLENLSKILINTKISRKSLENLYIYRDDKVDRLYTAEGNSLNEAYNNLTEKYVKIFEEEAREDYISSLCLDDDELEEFEGGEDIEVPQEHIDSYVKNSMDEFLLNITFVCRGDNIQKTISDLLENDDADSFTDCYTRKSLITLGVPVSMKRDECDSNPNRTCSSGLHIGAPGYVKDFGNGNNKAVIACLVNPADVVAVPYDYGFMKMRTCKYYPYAVCELNPDGSVVEINTQYFEEDYCDYEIKELEMLKDSYQNQYTALSTEEAINLIRNRLTVIESI